MYYTHLSLDERYRIEAMFETGRSCQAIARALGRSTSTISRERQRCPSGEKAYCATKAHTRYIQSKAPNARTLDESVWLVGLSLLKEEWSPDQISLRLKEEANGVHQISRQTFYARIGADKRAGGTWYKLLRHGRPYRKRNTKETRGKIPNRQDISERPAEVEERKVVGHFEGDTMIGAKHQGVLVTLTERVTGLTLIKAVPNKTAEVVAAAMIELLGPIREWVKTLTLDNGLEFAEHQKITAAIGAQVYFAKPYSSWQRGTNENTNGLIRQYFKKGTSLKNVRECDVHHAMFRLNNRPRKRLKYKSPLEVFAKHTGTDYSHLSGFMLRS